MSEMPKQEAKHTPEPWAVQQTADGPRIVALGDNVTRGSCIANMAEFGSQSRTPYAEQQNARRIVACVNACEGMNTETLEIAADGGPNVKEWFSGWADGFRVEERDELLDALQGLYALHTGEHGPDDYDEARRRALEKAEAALAKAANSR